MNHFQLMKIQARFKCDNYSRTTYNIFLIMHKQLIKVYVFCVLLLLSCIGQASNQTLMNFQEFKAKFNKTYQTPNEEQNRRTVFNSNRQKIIENTCTQCGISKFSDWTEAEFKGMLTLKKSQIVNKTQVFRSYKKQNVQAARKMIPNYQLLQAPPASFDWRDQNAVTSVKNQGGCGSCWAFSATACAQSFAIIRGLANNTVDLSQQFLLSCTPGSGCNGGYLHSSMQTVINSNGMPNQATLPYIASVSSNVCQTPRNITNIASHYLMQGDMSDQEIIAMLMLGPLNIALAADSFGNYVPGGQSVTGLRCQLGDPVNHAVLLIGYTPAYWIIKNSWGEDFGDGGYMYITRDRTDNANCQIGCSVTIFTTSCDIQNCALCRGLQVSCQICSSGYSLDYTSTYIYKCKACTDPNCDLCYPYWYGEYSGQCYTCKVGHSINVLEGSTNSCDIISIQNCAQYYNSSGVTYCYTCNQGYIRNSASSLCLKCNVQRCQTCVVNQQNTCQTCQDGYVGPNCTPRCNFTNCASCLIPDVCHQCKSGWLLPTCATPICTLTNCINCSAPNVCRTCKPGFSGITCQAIACNVTSNCVPKICISPNVCKSCKTGYSGNRCQIVSCNNLNNCANCSTPGVCGTCVNGFSVPPTCTKIACFRNISTINCQNRRNACSVNSSKCDKCITGWSGNNCSIRCTPANCMACLTINNCSQCNSGYQRLSNGTCRALQSVSSSLQSQGQNSDIELTEQEPSDTNPQAKQHEYKVSEQAPQQQVNSKIQEVSTKSGNQLVVYVIIASSLLAVGIAILICFLSRRNIKKQLVQQKRDAIDQSAQKPVTDTQLNNQKELQCV